MFARTPRKNQEGSQVREVEIAVVGGGPAGLAAAFEAARAGAETVLLDEYHTLGGQYYKQVPHTFRLQNPDAEGKQYYSGYQLIDRLHRERVEILLDCLVWGIFEERTLALCRNGRTEQLKAKKLILAPGAQERPIAFPGWTLPGVMMGGAAQALLVSQRFLPGRRIVLAGVGPLQLRVASQLLDAGAEIVDIVEASDTPPMSMRNALRSLGHWGKMREGLQYWMALAKARAPYHHRHLPVRALGTKALEAVVVAEVDADWNVIPGTERMLDADTLCLSYGFVPSTQLPRLAGCEQVFDAAWGGWVTRHDADQATNQPGVYVAGEAGSIGGADVAEEEGRIAAIAAARALGRIAPHDRAREEKQARRALAKAKKFAAIANAMMTLKPAVWKLITDETLICRCEEVAAREVVAAVRSGGASARGVKIRTRAGKGLCQGRTCGPLVAELIALHTGCGLAAVKPDRPRPPIKPVPLLALAAGAE
jgi:NADPH-dependent 2,4-dienoyl-CoA reductase/sulfur reductase-like enzyme